MSDEIRASSRHRHLDAEELSVIDGTLAVEGHLRGPGEYFAAAGGSVRGAVFIADGCRFLVSASEEDEPTPSAEPSGHDLLFVPGRARLSDGRVLRAGDFCGTVKGTTTVTDSPEGGLLLALGARGAIAREADS